MENEINISERLSELIAERNIDNNILAAAVGVDSSTVRRWLRNGTYMYLSQIIKIADYFNCSLEFLIKHSDKTIDFVPQERPSFYGHFRKLLKEKGISRYKINKETRIKSSHFTDWKKGSDPQLLSLIALAEYLNVTLDFLVGREK